MKTYKYLISLNLLILFLNKKWNLKQNLSIVLFLAFLGIFPGFCQNTSLEYNDSLLQIKGEKNKLLQEHASAEEIAVFFEKTLIERVFPYWYGTEWSFEGHTSVPKKGKIACGYFVSTTLKHLGLNLNRYKLAQQLPLYEAKSLSNDVWVIKGESWEELRLLFYKKIEQDGVYFIGLDENHVGYLYRSNNVFYFIHSNYFTGKVEKEEIDQSIVLKSFFTFYIVPLSTNEVFLNKWLRNIPFVIVTAN